MYMSLTLGDTDLFYKNSMRKLLLTTGIFSLLFIQTDTALIIINQPLPQTDCYGNLVQFSISLNGSVGIVTFQWQRKPPGESFTNLPGENNASLAVYNIGMYGENTDGTEYRVVVSDDFGIVASEAAVLHVNSITNLTPAIVNSLICYGGEITYNVFSRGTALNYQWEFNNGSGWFDLSNNTIFSGSTTSQLNILNATTSESGSYRVKITFATLNQPVSDPVCVETSYTRVRNLTVREPVITSAIYHR